MLRARQQPGTRPTTGTRCCRFERPPGSPRPAPAPRRPAARARRDDRPAGLFGDPRLFEEEYAFIVGQLVPHIEAIEATLYGRLEQLMGGRHSMAPMRASTGAAGLVRGARPRTAARGGCSWERGRGDRPPAGPLPAARDPQGPPGGGGALSRRPRPEPVRGGEGPPRPRHRPRDGGAAVGVRISRAARAVAAAANRSRYRALNSPISRARSFITAAHSSRAA